MQRLQGVEARLHAGDDVLHLGFGKVHARIGQDDHRALEDADQQQDGVAAPGAGEVALEEPGGGVLARLGLAPGRADEETGEGRDEDRGQRGGGAGQEKSQSRQHGAGMPQHGGEAGQGGEQREGLLGRLGIGVASPDDDGDDLDAGARLQPCGALGDAPAVGFGQGHFFLRKSRGSTAVPLASTVQCRCGPLVRPVLPERPTTWPAATRSPGATSMRSR